MDIGANTDLADLFWQALDPQSYYAAKQDADSRNAPQMDVLRKKYPEKIRSDSTPGYSGLEDRLLNNSNGFVDALITRNDQFAKDAAYGPLSGDDLNKIIMQFFNSTQQTARRVKSQL